MRVVQIIPAVFCYFETITKKAFFLAEKIQEAGVEIVPFTLQSYKPNKRLRQVARESGEGGGFSVGENLVLSQLENLLLEADIIQIHTPFLGFGSQLLKFKKKHPEKPLIVVHHGSLSYQDLFSMFIAGYTAWYLPKLIKTSEGFLLPLESGSKNLYFRRCFRENRILTNGESKVQLLCRQKTVSAFLENYLKLLMQHVYL